MAYETVEIPFVTIGNRQALTERQTYELPWLMEFIRRFPKCFEYSDLNQAYLYYPDGDAPCS